MQNINAETSNVLIITHAPCADGMTSKWIAYQKFGENAQYADGIYGTEPPDVDGKDVYILDFSYRAEVMSNLAKRANSITVIDHHKTAEEDLKLLLEDGTVEGEFDMNRSGASMAWDFFFPDKKKPKIISYVEDRDLWKYSLPSTDVVAMAIFMYKYNITEWDELMKTPIKKLIELGTPILRKHRKDMQDFIDVGMVETINFQGYEDIPLVNVPYTFGSDICHILSKDKPFAMYYYYENGGIKVGMRSQDDGEDVGNIAYANGGGGHRNASGFFIKNKTISYLLDEHKPK